MTTSPERAIKNTPLPKGFLLSNPAHLVACGFGSGAMPSAPGTWGTLFAWLTFPFLIAALGDAGFLWWLAIAYVGGVIACDRTGRDLGVIDHGSIVWDEIVPFWTVLLLTPQDWRWQLAAFVLFRYFDIVKPPPARQLDRFMKNGLGVMLDDVVAAFYTLLVLAIGKFILG